MVTEIYVRVKREGRWTNSQLEWLTDEEWSDFTARHPDAGWCFAKGLRDWIRKNIRDAEEG